MGRVKLVIFSLVMILIISRNTSVYAEEKTKEDNHLLYTIDLEDETLNAAVLISDKSYIKKGRLITEKVYDDFPVELQNLIESPKIEQIKE